MSDHIRTLRKMLDGPDAIIGLSKRDRAALDAAISALAAQGGEADAWRVDRKQDGSVMCVAFTAAEAESLRALGHNITPYYLHPYVARIEAMREAIRNGLAAAARPQDTPPVPVERGEDSVMATGGHWMDAGRRKVYERCAREMENLIEQAADIDLDEMTVAALGTARDVLREKATTDKPRPDSHVDVAGWIHEDELPDRYPYDAMFPHSKVDVVRTFPVFVPAEGARVTDADVWRLADYLGIRPGYKNLNWTALVEKSREYLNAALANHAEKGEGNG